MPVTLSDIALEAGVSLATASRAINGSAGRTVRPELRERVLEAATRLQYSPDANAQAMARGRTTTLGLIVHDIADPYFSSIAAGVSGAAERAGLAVMLSTTQHEKRKELQLIEILQRQRARAVVLVGSRDDDPDALADLRHALRSYRATGGSVALVGQPLLEVDTVSVANERGSAELARALHGLGYRRFGVLGGPAPHLTARERRHSFTDTLAALGSPVPGSAVLATDFHRDGGYDGMRRLLAQNDGVEAVFAVNDVMAVGAMAAARDAGLVVGVDVAVAGFDDIVTLRDVTPGLTTVRLPLLELGRRATQMALSSSPGEEPRVVEVEGEVVLRDSTPGLPAPA